MSDVHPAHTEEPYPSHVDSFSPDQRRLLRMLALSLVLHLSLMAVLSGLPGGGPGEGPAAVMEVSLNDIPAMEEPVSDTVEEISAAPPEEAPASEPESASAIPEPADDTRVSPPRADSRESMEPSSISFSISAGSFTSFGEGTSLKDEIRPYFLEMLQRINRSWQNTGRGVRLTRGAMILVSIDREGKLRDVRILQGSGNRSHDRMLMAAVETTLFEPLPENYRKDTFEAPIRFTPPLSLLSFDGLLSNPPPH